MSRAGHYQYQIHHPPKYDESSSLSVSSVCHGKVHKNKPYRPQPKYNYKPKCGDCTKPCLPKCGNLFMNACLGDFSCESLVYTKLFINSFPEAARCRVLHRVRRNEVESGCLDD